MEDNEIHYLTYDPDAIWDAMMDAYLEAGGDVVYPGDEKEMLLRGVQSIVMQAFAGIDNALRMNTLRYAVGEYLDIYGEKRNCYRIRSTAASAKVQFTFMEVGSSGVIAAGTPLTADGSIIYVTVDDIVYTGYAETLTADIICNENGAKGNGLLAGTEMQTLVPTETNNIQSIYVTVSASGGQNEEDDETYRERIRLYGLNAITTGPAEQYERVTMAVSSEIIDAAAINGGGGVVNVYLIPASSTGTEALIAAVQSALRAEDTRPLTDQVSVALATKKTYTLNIEYAVYTGQNIGAALSEAVTQYKDWQEKKIGRAFNPDRLKALLYQAGCNRVEIGDGSAFDSGDAVYTEIASNEYCSGTITLAVIEE